MAHYRRQVALARRLAAEAALLWRGLDPDVLDLAWAGIAPRMLALVSGGQYLSASDAEGYLDQVLKAQGIDPTAAGQVNARALVGVASDGRDLASLLDQPMVATKTAIGQGSAPADALRVGAASLNMIVRTQLADAGRGAVGLGIVSRPRVSGYVRMLSPPSCARCVILAGRTYKWNKGFQRHPNCDCRHIPSSEDVWNDLRSNPQLYVESLDRAEKERILGKAASRAFDDGGDLSQLVNARRGMQTASVHGRQALITSEGTTRLGLAGHRLGARNDDAIAGTTQSGIVRTVTRAKAPRLMPEQIYADAEKFGLTREQTLAVLRRHAYIL